MLLFSLISLHTLTKPFRKFTKYRNFTLKWLVAHSGLRCPWPSLFPCDVTSVPRDCATWSSFNAAQCRVNSISMATVKQWGSRVGNIYLRFRNYRRSVSKPTPPPPQRGSLETPWAHTYSSSSSSIAQ